MPTTSRDPLPDALRAVALLGVLLINSVGYPEAPSGAMLGHAARDALDSATQFVLACFVQGKAYPLLAMLFGMGLVWAGRGRLREQAQARFAQRQQRLLVLGVLHGTLLYFGDILTLYAISAWSLWSTVHARWTVVRGQLRRAVFWALLVVGAQILLAGFTRDATGLDVIRASLGRTQTLFDFVALNALVYATNTFFGLLLALPIVRLCMLSGLAAARLGCLTRRRWQAWREAAARRLFWPALAVNVAYGVGVALAMARSSQQPWWADAFSPLVGLALAAWYALTLSNRWHRGQRGWAHALAPLGRRTLSVYIGLSVCCALLFSGVGLGWAPGTPVIALLALAGWAGLAIAAAASRRRWPFEWWMGRRT